MLSIIEKGSLFHKPLSQYLRGHACDGTSPQRDLLDYLRALQATPSAGATSKHLTAPSAEEPKVALRKELPAPTLKVKPKVIPFVVMRALGHLHSHEKLVRLAV